MADMIQDRPTIGALFDISKMGLGVQRENCWRIFWQAVDPAAIKGTKLFDGEARVGAGCFCIAVQGMDASPLEAVMAALLENARFMSVCAASMFAQGESVSSQPLAPAGEIDIFGAFVGEPGASRSALEAVRPDAQARSGGEAPPGLAVASPMTTIGSHMARAALMGDPFGGGPSEEPGQTEARADAAQEKAGRTKVVIWIVVAILAAALVAALVLMRAGLIPLGRAPSGARQTVRRLPPPGGGAGQTSGPTPEPSGFGRAGGRPAGTSLDGSAKPGPKKGARAPAPESKTAE